MHYPGRCVLSNPQKTTFFLRGKSCRLLEEGIVGNMLGEQLTCDQQDLSAGSVSFWLRWGNHAVILLKQTIIPSIIILNIGTATQPDQTVKTQTVCSYKRGLTWICTVCHSLIPNILMMSTSAWFIFWKILQDG